MQPQHPFWLNSASQPNQFISLLTHPKHHSSLRWGPQLSPQHTGAHTMPRVFWQNPRADSSDEESPPKNHCSAPLPRSLLPPPLREQRQTQRRPQRAPIQKIRNCNRWSSTTTKEEREGDRNHTFQKEKPPFGNKRATYQAPLHYSCH